MFRSRSPPGLCQVKNPLSCLLQQGGDVLEQLWPTVDPKYLDVPDFVELSVLVGLHRRTHMISWMCVLFCFFSFILLTFTNTVPLFNKFSQQGWKNMGVTFVISAFQHKGFLVSDILLLIILCTTLIIGVGAHFSLT